MQQTAFKPVEMSYEDIFDKYAKFHGTVKPSNVDGVKYLKIEVELPFRDRHEVGEWMHAFASKLASDSKLDADPKLEADLLSNGTN